MGKSRRTRISRAVAVLMPVLCMGIFPFHFAGCEDGAIEPSDWRAPYELWKSYGLGSYTIAQTRNCFCPHGGETMRVVVRSDSVVSVRRQSDSLQISPAEWGEYLTVDSMFAIIRRPGSDSIRVRYNETYGYPEQLDINPQLQPIDAGVTYLLSGLKAASFPPGCDERVTITQGVWGYVRFWEGDFMPVTPTGTITPVVREILVYEATRFDSVGGTIAGGFCDTVYSRFVTGFFSDTSGFFQVPLRPGKYSFFVREDTLHYANLYDGEGHIQPATVFTDSLTKLPIEITYRATF